MRHRQLCFGNQIRQLQRQPVDGLDPVMEEKYLSSALQLTKNRIADDLFVIPSHVSLDRQPIRRRGFNDTQITNADQRHMQGARDRRRRQADHVDELAQLFQALLVDDTEAMLFINDNQAQIFKLHILLQQSMGSDQNVDVTAHGLLEDFRDLLRGQETADHFNAYRVIAKPLPKSLEMLLRQNRRRRQHGNLLAALDGKKSRSHRYFGLAVTDITADQAVHRFSALHARQGLIDGALLIGSFFELESRFEFPVQCVGRREGISLAGFPSRIELYELFSHRKNSTEDRRVG